MNPSTTLLVLSSIACPGVFGQPAWPDYVDGLPVLAESRVAQPGVQIPLRPNPFTEFAASMRDLVKRPGQAKVEALFWKGPSNQIDIEPDVARLEALIRDGDWARFSLMFKDLDFYPSEAKAREYWTKRIRTLTPHTATVLCIVYVDGGVRGWLPMRKSDQGLLIVPSGR